MRIDLDKVPTRQSNMKTWELLLSESQERMLLVAVKGREEEVTKIFSKWDLPCSVIGEVTDDGLLNFYMNEQLEASLPAYELVLGGGAPQYEREYKEPGYFTKIREFNPADIEVPMGAGPSNPRAALLLCFAYHVKACAKSVDASGWKMTSAMIGGLDTIHRFPGAALDLFPRYGRHFPGIHLR